MQEEHTGEEYEALPDTLKCWYAISFSYVLPDYYKCKVCEKKDIVMIKHLGYLHLTTDPEMCVPSERCNLFNHLAVTIYCEACGIEALNSIKHYTHEYKRIRWGQQTIKVVKKLPPWRRAERSQQE